MPGRALAAMGKILKKSPLPVHLQGNIIIRTSTPHALATEAAGCHTYIDKN